MFKYSITNTALTTSDASMFFQNISGSSFLRDISFLASLRALLHSRMPENEYLRLRIGSSSYGHDALETNTATRVFNAIVSGFDSKEGGVLYIHNVRDYIPNDASASANLDLIEMAFIKKYKASGWSRLEKVTNFYVKDFKCLCFINEKLHSTAVFVENMDIAKWHYLQCSIFAFFPWYFDPKKGVTELEMALIESLRKKTSDDYINIIQEISKQFDIRACIIKRQLKGFELQYEKAEMDKVRRDISSIDRDINSYSESIHTLLQRRRDREIRLLGLETKVSQTTDEPSEIMEYFLCNKNLTLDSVNGSEITFVAKGYVEYFDESMAKKIISNKSGYVYRSSHGDSYSSDISATQMEKFMRAVFLEQTLKIRVCAAYRFNASGDVQPKTYYGFGKDFEDCMPNLHIDKFSCMGNYRQTIVNLLRDREYIGAIEQCIASCKSLNFGDSTVMREVMKFLYGVSGDYAPRDCVELPDGSVVSPAKAIEWLENCEEKAEEKVEEKGEENNE